MSNMISVVVPTYKEVANLRELSERINASLSVTEYPYEIVFVDDNSNDGSEELAAELANSLPVRMIVRRDERGLSTAVLTGIEQAKGDYIVVMDADLSHPPEKLPDVVALLANHKADFVIGSRYVKGGSTGEEWGLLRKLNSLGATWLALPLVKIRDPMSGFFGFRKAEMPARDKLSPIGYKIGLELLVKGDFQNPDEVPIHFVDRTEGESKMTFGEQIKYLRHLRRLYQYRYPLLSEFVHFGGVGASGFAVDLALYLGLQSVFGLGYVTARAISFWPAATWNWAANRLLTFPHRKKMAKLIQWPAFVASSTLGFAVNWGSFYLLTKHVDFFTQHDVLAMVVGVMLGMGFNFSLSRTLIFRRIEQDD